MFQNKTGFAIGVLLRASEGTKPSANLKAYSPYFMDMTLPNMPLGMDATAAAQAHADHWKGKEEKRIEKRAKRDLKAARAAGASPTGAAVAVKDRDEPLVEDADVNEIYEGARRYYTFIEEADSHVAALAGLPLAVVQGFKDTFDDK
jgi:hypothetical protein